MPSKLATSLFQDHQRAITVIKQLEDAGIAGRDISLFSDDATTSRMWDGGRWGDTELEDRGHAVADWLRNEGVPSSDAETYGEGVNRGGALIAVRCDERNADQVLSVLSAGLDLDESRTSWRAGGWQPRHEDGVVADTGAAGLGHGRARVHRYEDRTARESENVATGETDRLIASDKVEGTVVYNRAGERLGTVHNFMVDKHAGRVAYAVMSFGGFLGVGERYHPLPWKSLDYDPAMGGFVVDIDRERLERAPHYGRDEDPWTNPSYGRGVYDYYGVQPYV